MQAEKNTGWELWKFTVSMRGKKVENGNSERLTVPVGGGKGTDRTLWKAHSARRWGKKHRPGTLKGSQCLYVEEKAQTGHSEERKAQSSLTISPSNTDKPKMALFPSWHPETNKWTDNPYLASSSSTHSTTPFHNVQSYLNCYAFFILSGTRANLL